MFLWLQTSCNNMLVLIPSCWKTSCRHNDIRAPASIWGVYINYVEFNSDFTCWKSDPSVRYKVHIKVMWIYIAPCCETSKVLRHRSYSFTCKQHHACLYLVFTRWHHHWLWSQTSNCSLLLNYWKAESAWLATYSGRFTHISGHPLALGQVQDRESSPVKDQHPTVVLGNQLHYATS